MADTSESGRKLNRNLGNPVDNFFVDINEEINPYYKKLNFTPNMLTTFSLLFTIFSAYLFVIDYRFYAAFFYMVGYYFDCADGNYARKYKMVSKFGDLYDHVTDLIKIGIFLVLLYTEYKDKTRFTNFFIIFVVLSFLATVHLGCQEALYGKSSESMFLRLTKLVCIDPKHINVTRFFGTGTLQLFMAIILIFY